MGLITSLLDLDLYKLSMQQAVFHQFRDVHVKYKFVDRKQILNINNIDIEELMDELDSISKLYFSVNDIDYLKSLNLFQDDYLKYLKTFHLKYHNTKIDWNNPSDLINITIEGKWVETILWETLILSTVQEMYTKRMNQQINIKIGKEKFDASMNKLNVIGSTLNLMEFGTRRRFSHAWQDQIIQKLVTINNSDRNNGHLNLLGTSNVYFAKKYNIKPLGTIAHEFIQAGLQLAPTTIEGQKFMLQAWKNEYGDKLDIALTDTFGMDAFLRDINELPFVHKGFRHDSGDPKKWFYKLDKYMKDHYENKPYNVVFSDSLTINSALLLNAFCRDINPNVNVSFGIGTSLTNNMMNPALSIVIKLVEVNGMPVAKLSDEPAKTIGDSDYVNYLKEVMRYDK